MNLVFRIVGRGSSRPPVIRERDAMRHESGTRTPSDPRRALGRAGGTALRSLFALLVVAGLGGCRGLGVPIAQWRSSYDSGLAQKLTKDELAHSGSQKLADSDSLLQRWLRPRGAAAAADDPGDPSKDEVVWSLGKGFRPFGKSKGDGEGPKDDDASSLVLGSDGWRPMIQAEENPEAQKELDEALELFQRGDLARAESALAKIAKKRKETPWGEKAQFYLAETQYQRKKYTAAHDSFERLVAEYPGTQYLDKLVSREYALAQLWLSQDDPNIKPEDKLPWYSRFTGGQPLIDTRGQGLKALEHVRHHDPTGPLADDAVMQIANYHMDTADYETAAIYFDQLMTDHPKSPFLQQAQLAAIDARMKGYLGPEYDGEGLEQARELVKRTMDSFPDQPSNYEKLYHTLDLINDQDAERTYKVGAYYKKIGKVASAEYYLGKIPQRWPTSPWAVKAKADLAQLAKMPRKETLPSKMLVQPGANDPYYSAGPAAGGMGGMGGGMMPGGMM